MEQWTSLRDADVMAFMVGAAKPTWIVTIYETRYVTDIPDRDAALNAYCLKKFPDARLGECDPQDEPNITIRQP